MFLKPKMATVVSPICRPFFGIYKSLSLDLVRVLSSELASCGAHLKLKSG